MTTALPMENITSLPACSQVQIIAQSPVAKGILLAKGLLSIVAVLSTSILIFRKGIRWIAHPNAKLLYSLHIFWVFAISTMNICVFFFDFIRLSLPVTNSCDRLLTIGFCMGTKMLTILAIVAQETSMLAFALERAYATIYPVAYEKVKTCEFGIFMGILSIFLAAGVKYGLMLPGLNFSTLTATYDVIFPGNVDIFQISLYVEMGIEGSTGLVFAITYLWNYILKKRSVRDSSVLGKKYQVTENQQFIILLFPCFILHFFLNILVIILLSLYPWVRNLWLDTNISDLQFFAEDYLTRFIWTESCSQPFIYGMILPILVQYRLRKVEKDRAKRPRGFTLSADDHFNELRRMFDGPTIAK